MRDSGSRRAGIARAILILGALPFFAGIATGCPSTSQPPPPPPDAGPGCVCTYDPGRVDCPREDDPTTAACLRMHGGLRFDELMRVEDCFEACGDLEEAAKWRCAPEPTRRLYECFAQQSEMVVACVAGDPERYETCVGQATTAWPCTDELAALRACGEDGR